MGIKRRTEEETALTYVLRPFWSSTTPLTRLIGDGWAAL
jgi:hypothetical protein